MPKCKICKSNFEPKYSTLQPVCGRKECRAAYNRDKKQKSSNKLKPVSDKRAIENKAYSILRKVFLEGKMCAVYPHLKATDVHHMNKRNGDRLNDVKDWLAVSREGHMKIHNEPEWAKQQGWLK